MFQETLDGITGHGADGVRVVAEARGLSEAEAQSLKQLPGVLALHTHAERDWLRLELQAEAQAGVREAVFGQAVRQGWTLRELRREQASLEDIFVRLTAREDPCETSLP